LLDVGVFAPYLPFFFIHYQRSSIAVEQNLTGPMIKLIVWAFPNPEALQA